MRSVSLGPAPPVLEAAVTEGWLDDEDLNYRMGWGKGDEGRLVARKYLEHVIGNGFYGIYRGGKPVGWVASEQDRSTVRLEIFLPKKHEGKGFGVTILEKLLEEAFKKGIPRVEIEVVDPNHPARKFLRHFGFNGESRRWNRVWMGGRWWDSYPFSMTPDWWEKVKKQRRRG